MTAHLGRYEMTFSGNKDYTLTTSFVASSAIRIAFTKKVTVFPYYTPGVGGTGNKLNYQIEINPYSAEEDPTNLYWSPVGDYIDSSGTWTEEPGTFLSLAGTASTQSNLVNLDLTDAANYQLRIKAKETVGGGSAGTARFVVTTNTIN